MDIDSARIGAWVGQFFWPFLRLSAFLLAAPVFGARSVPVRVRITIGLALTVVLLPTLPAAPPLDVLSPLGVLTAVQQIGIGVLGGFLLQLFLAALSFAGEMVSLGMGLGFASLVDPQSGVSVPLLAQLYVMLVILLMLAADGHLLLLELLARSFTTLPVGPVGLRFGDFRAVAGFVSDMFALGLLVALPAVTVLLVVNLAFAVISRAAPQLNLFAIGFPVSLLVGLLIVLLTLPALPGQWDGIFGQATGRLAALLGGR